MKTIKVILSLCLVFIICSSAFAQNDTLLRTLPVTKEEFTQSERKVIATINWLENTPMDEQQDKRKAQTTLLVGWITDAPEITLEINTAVTPFATKNPELLGTFMGGWTKYSLQNNYSTHVIQGSLAGIRSAIKVYNKGVGLKKDKEMDKLAELQEKGELEKWVTDKLAKK